MLLRYWGLLLVSISLFGQPAVPPRGIVNAASFIPPDLPGGAVARGSIFAISGSGLGPATAAKASALPLQTALGGVSIKVSQLSSAVDALPLFASAGQIYAIMPSNAPLGRVSVVVTFNAVKSNPAPITVVASSFGIFNAASLNLTPTGSIGALTSTAAGYGPAFVQNVTADGSFTPNVNALPAMPGQNVMLLGTGLGAIKTPDNAVPPPDTLSTPVEVFVGGEVAPVVSSGRSGFPGLDQITFTLPADVVTGCYVPVQVRTNAAQVSNTQTIAISADGSDCTASLNPVSLALATPGNLGMAVLLRATLHADIDTLTPFDLSLDTGVAGFAKYPAGGPYQAQFGLPPGTCATWAMPHDLFDTTQAAAIFQIPTLLNSGAGSVAGAKGLQPLRNNPAHLLGGFFGGSLPFLPTRTPYLDPGDYTVATAGGPDIGPVQATVTAPAPINWTNRDQILTIDRSKPLSLTWDAGDPAVADPNLSVLVVGANVDVPTNSTGLFACLSAPGAASVSVPAAILSTVPPSRVRYGQYNGVLFVGPFSPSAPAMLTALGVDAGVVLPLVFSGKTVLFQ